MTDQPTGDCFRTAIETATELAAEPLPTLVLAREITVCHGQPIYQGKPGPELEPHGRYWHAWVEVADTIDLSPLGVEGATTVSVHYVDRSNGNDYSMPRELAYAVGRLTDTDAPPIHRYTIPQAVTAVAVFGQWGPWDDTPEEEG
jgi:hypothetical protein